MADPRKTSANRSKQIAVGGVFAAIAIVIMLSGGLFPVATFTAPVLASLCLLPVMIELGPKTALLAYLAVSILSFMLVPDQELVLFFVLLTGYYPMLQPKINGLRFKPLRWFFKLLLFNGAVAAVYALLLLLFTSPALQQELASRPWWFWGILLGAGNATFVLYDILLGKVRFVYLYKLRKMIFRR